MIGVFSYLVWRSAHNRIARQLRHLRSPRYLAALLLGIGYIWFILLAQPSGPAAARDPNPQTLELVGALLLIGTVAWGWVFGVERRVLTFSPAEVTFLFSAPVSRRGLIQFKLLRSQLLILFNAVLWTLILSRERFGVSSWLRAISIWVLLTTLSLHRLGASFVRTSLAEHGRFGVRHRLVSLIVLAAVLIALVWSVVDARPYLASARALEVPEFLDAAKSAAARPVPSALTYPFRLMIRPLTATDPSQWLAAVWPALLLLGLHYIWVVRSDSAFEEAAAEASLRRAQALAERTARSSPERTRPATPPLFRLAPDGWPGNAILWKNLVAVTRTRRVRNVAVALGAAAVVVTLLSFNPTAALAEIAGWLAVCWSALLVVIGPQWVRNDLRGDLLKLDLLRSYPLRGWSIVASEAAASTLLLTAIQLSLLAIAYLAFLGIESMAPDLEGRTIILVAGIAVLPAVNFLGMLIQNGAALLYPAWVHLGAGRPGGVEALGQNMLMMIAFVVLLGITLLLPGAAGLGVHLLLRDALGVWALIPAGGVLLATIALEAALLVDWLGGVFERTDPATAGVPS